MAQPHNETELLDKLRRAIAGTRAVMVGVADHGVRHFNPMKSAGGAGRTADLVSLPQRRAVGAGLGGAWRRPP